MTDLSPLLKADKGQRATPLHLVDKNSFEAWLKDRPARERHAIAAQGFKGEGFQLAILPGERDEWSAVLGVANVAELSVWCLARAAESLPEGASANFSPSLVPVLPTLPVTAITCTCFARARAAAPRSFSALSVSATRRSLSSPL